jgi:hypothetical protein
MTDKEYIEQDKQPHQVDETVTTHELIEQMQAQVEYFDKLPNHLQFSYCTNADLNYFMLLILNIFKGIQYE